VKKTDEHNFRRRVFVRFFCSYRIIDNFYPWLKAHQGDFEIDYNKMIDRSGLQKLNLCPECNLCTEEGCWDDACRDKCCGHE